MGQSTITLQMLVDTAMSNGDTAPALATGGFSDQPALRIADTVMTAMLLGGPNGQPMNWKFNRANVTPFPTISWQQDYFVPGVVTLGWLEHCWACDINGTSQPKRKFQMEVRKDLDTTYIQTGYAGKISWLPNRLLLTGTWGATELQTITGQNNPGPGVVYTNPIGASSQPANPITQITDPNGNLWVVTVYGTCGSVQPSWPASPVYPTLDSPSTTATTVIDGGVTWTSVNPEGQGFRLNPIPPQTGIVWTINPVMQVRLKKFTSLGQTLDPVPDDYYALFEEGFLAQCYRRHPDRKVRAKFPQEWNLWLRALENAIQMANREQDDFGFVPSENIMQSGTAMYPNQQTPAWPWSGVAGY
jgi:hypothetical protein